MLDEITGGSSGDRSEDRYHRILANVALYLVTNTSSLAGTFTFQKEHKTTAVRYDDLDAYRAAALANVDRLALDELTQSLRLELSPDSEAIEDVELLKVAKDLIQKEIIEEKLEGKTYYLKARLVADPEQISQAVSLVQEIDDKIAELNRAKDRAEKAMEEVQRLEQEVRLARLKGEFLKNVEKQDKELDEVQDLLAKAKKSFSSGQYASAIAIYTSVLERGKQQLECHLYRGACYFHMGQYERAANDFSSTIELDPFNALAYHNRASSMVKAGRLNEALEDYNRALELEDNYSEAFRNRGITYLKYLGDYERALSDFNRLVSLRPQDAGAYFLRGTAYGKMGKFEEAYQDYMRAMEGMRGNAWLHYNTGNCLLRMGRYQEAIASYSRAIELRGDIASFYHNRGLAYARENQFSEALQDLEMALALGPDDGKSIMIRGFLFWKIGEMDEAKKQWEKAAHLGETKAVELLEQLGQ